jgi:2-haloacid dehalogenase
MLRCVWIDRGTGRRLLDDYIPDITLPALDKVPEAFRSCGWM